MQQTSTQHCFGCARADDVLSRGWLLRRHASAAPGGQVRSTGGLQLPMNLIPEGLSAGPPGLQPNVHGRDDGVILPDDVFGSEEHNQAGGTTGADLNKHRPPMQSAMRMGNSPGPHNLVPNGPGAFGPAPNGPPRRGPHGEQGRRGMNPLIGSGGPRMGPGPGRNGSAFGTQGRGGVFSGRGGRVPDGGDAGAPGLTQGLVRDDLGHGLIGIGPRDGGRDVSSLRGGRSGPRGGGRSRERVPRNGPIKSGFLPKPGGAPGLEVTGVQE